MKRRMGVQFYSTKTGETAYGQCPVWIAKTRRIRPDLSERPLAVYSSGPIRCLEGCQH